MGMAGTMGYNDWRCQASGTSTPPWTPAAVTFDLQRCWRGVHGRFRDGESLKGALHAVERRVAAAQGPGLRPGPRQGTQAQHGRVKTRTLPSCPYDAQVWTLCNRTKMITEVATTPQCACRSLCLGSRMGRAIAHSPSLNDSLCAGTAPVVRPRPVRGYTGTQQRSTID